MLHAGVEAQNRSVVSSFGYRCIELRPEMRILLEEAMGECLNQANNRIRNLKKNAISRKNLLQCQEIQVFCGEIYWRRQENEWLTCYRLHGRLHTHVMHQIGGFGCKLPGRARLRWHSLCLHWRIIRRSRRGQYGVSPICMSYPVSAPSYHWPATISYNLLSISRPSCSSEGLRLVIDFTPDVSKEHFKCGCLAALSTHHDEHHGIRTALYCQLQQFLTVDRSGRGHAACKDTPRERKQHGQHKACKRTRPRKGHATPKDFFGKGSDRDAGLFYKTPGKERTRTFFNPNWIGRSLYSSPTTLHVSAYIWYAEDDARDGNGEDRW